LAANPATIDSNGGSGVLKIDTARECKWTLSTTASWIRFGSALEGQGPGELPFTIEPNRSTEARQLELSVADVADARAAISQQAAVCVWKVTPDTISMGAAGGDARAALATEDFCAWTIASRVPWINITSDLAGTGSAEVSMHVDGNGGAARSGSVEFPSGTIRVDQQEAPKPAPVPVPPPAPAPSPAPKPCAYDVTPNRFDNVAATASDINIDVSTTAGCAWTATTSASWITVKSPAGAGSAKAAFTVTANSGDKRSGSVVVAGRTINVTQNAAPCTYSVSPGSLHVTSGAQSSQITVTTKAYCKVSVASSASSWLHVGTFPSTGGGKVPLTIDQNGSTSKRNATLNVTGDGGFAQAVPVQQDGR
jgi:hypothetical protein